MIEHYVSEWIMNRFQAQAVKSFPETIQKSGEYELQYHRSFKLLYIFLASFLILVSIAFFAFMVFAMLFGVNKIVWDMETIGLMIFVSAIFGCMGFAGIYMIYLIIKKPIRVTPYQISQQTRYKNIEIAWDSISEVDWSPSNKGFIIHANSGDKLCVNVFMPGVCYFVVDLCRKVDKSKLEKAMPGITLCNKVLKESNV